MSEIDPIQDAVDKIPTPYFINVLWDDEEDDWEVNTNLESDRDVLAVFSLILFQSAVAERAWDLGE